MNQSESKANTCTGAKCGKTSAISCFFFRIFVVVIYRVKRLRRRSVTLILLEFLQKIAFCTDQKQCVSFLRSCGLREDKTILLGQCVVNNFFIHCLKDPL